MYIYIDKYDYLVNNLNNDEIDEEIDHMEEKVGQISENNVIFFNRLKEKIHKERQEIDFNGKNVMQNRLENILNQIYVLQMRQIAESISAIKKSARSNKYILIFDSSENMKTLTLNEADYRHLLKYRDSVNSVSVYDLFQEKIHYYL
jgi:hypothetical protein